MDMDATGRIITEHFLEHGPCLYTWRMRAFELLTGSRMEPWRRRPWFCFLCNLAFWQLVHAGLPSNFV